MPTVADCGNNFSVDSAPVSDDVCIRMAVFCGRGGIGGYLDKLGNAGYILGK